MKAFNKFKVTCTLGTLDKAIAEIERLEKYRDYDGMVDRFIEYMASDIEDDVKEGYDRKNINYGGNTDIFVATLNHDNGSKKVVAQGQAIAFIEWGAGKTFGVDPNPLGGVGSYGKGYGSRNSWAYYGDPGTAHDESRSASGKHRHAQHIRGNWASNMIDPDTGVKYDSRYKEETDGNGNKTKKKNPEFREKKNGKVLYWTAGNPPHRVMSTAFEENVYDKWEEIAEQVFAND